MNSEEVQIKIVNLEQRITQRVQVLSADDPQIQRLMGQLEVYRIIIEESTNPKEEDE